MAVVVACSMGEERERERGGGVDGPVEMWKKERCIAMEQTDDECVAVIAGSAQTNAGRHGAYGTCRL